MNLKLLGRTVLFIIFTTLLFGRVNATTSLQDGLVAHYPFDGNARDVSGMRHHGTQKGGVTYLAGKIGQAASFNGTNGIIKATLPKLKKTYSVSLFAQFKSHRAENLLFYLTRKKHSDRLGYLSTYPVGKKTWHFGSRRYGKGWEDRGTTVVDPQGLLVNQWYHLVFVLNDKEISLFVNGNPLKTIQSIHNSDIEAHNNKLRLLIGGTTEKYQWMDGLIDDVRVYNRVLSAAEIKELAKGEITTKPDTKFSCDDNKRYCRDMTSCEEAYYHLQQCGRTSLDRDKDDIPCESLCANKKKELKFKVVKGDNQCPAGYTLVTPTEARANKTAACEVLGAWDIARLAQGGSMDGPDYNCKIRDNDKRELGHSLCKSGQTEPPKTNGTGLDLSGTWIGEGYKCGWKVFTEQVKIEQKGNSIVATKITGDDCVPAGSRTFAGNLDTINITWTTGYPNKPACCQTKGRLTLKDNDTLVDKKFKITFNRESSNPTTGLNLSGRWLGDGYWCQSSSKRLQESVEIEQNGKSIVATKITGDDCVLAGSRTFAGNLDTINITWTTGFPNRPACCQKKGKLTILDNNTMIGGGVKFKRVSPK